MQVMAITQHYKARYIEAGVEIQLLGMKDLSSQKIHLPVWLPLDHLRHFSKLSCIQWLLTQAKLQSGAGSLTLLPSEQMFILDLVWLVNIFLDFTFLCLPCLVCLKIKSLQIALAVLKPDCGTHTDPPSSVCLVLELKACATMPDTRFYFFG